MKEEVIEGNKLIARFMGEVTTETAEWISTTKRLVSELAYHSSWDWLMPVVEKINAMDNREYDVIIWRSDCHINNREQVLIESSILRGNMTLIETVWGCIVEFIKWYNQNQKKMTIHMGVISEFGFTFLNIKPPNPTTMNTQRWIPVSENKPDIGDYVLVSLDNGWNELKGRLMANGWVAMYSDGENFVRGNEVTHWMPLPPPPSETPSVSAEELAAEIYPLINKTDEGHIDNWEQRNFRRAYVNGFIRARQISMEEKRIIAEEAWKQSHKITLATVKYDQTRGITINEDWVIEQKGTYLNEKYPLPGERLND